MYEYKVETIHRQVLELVHGVRPHKVHGRRELTLDPLLEQFVLTMPEVLMVDGIPLLAGVRIYFDVH